MAAVIAFMRKTKTLAEIFLAFNDMFDEESGKQFAEAVDESSAPLETLSLAGTGLNSASATV